ncbi:MAG: M20/M25/M40 family metallo-hydrolase [Actinobacteria bacterium]|nr:M20/M25/M40 family metallo-hydrolase [Actinomycetota bacterium]
MSDSQRTTAVEKLLNREWSDIVSTLSDLIRIPSVSWPAFESVNVERSAEAVAQLAKELGVFDSVEILRSPIPGSSELGQPAVVARRASQNGAPTVLLYAHHDVQPPGNDDDWESPAFEPTERNGRLFGRGSADDKAGIVTHLFSIRLLLDLVDDVDLGLVLFIEGEEEFGSPSFDAFLTEHRDKLQADTIVVADSGNWSVDVPALTTSLRGNVTFALTIRTLDHGVHSGMFGGAVPDAMLAAARLIDSFYTANGSIAVAGLAVHDRQVPDYDEKTLRHEAGMLDSTTFIGAGDLMHRLWSQPAITVTGIDAPPVESASNTLLPSVRLRVSVRVAPGQRAVSALDAVRDHIAGHIPFGAQFTLEDVNLGEAFLDSGAGPAARAARAGMRDAWGIDPIDMGVGGSIPFIATFKQAFPDAEVLVTGVEDPDSRAHGTNESLHLEVLRRAIYAQTLLLWSLNGE